MEPNFKKIKFFQDELAQKPSTICNIYSCWRCQNKDPPDKETREKLKRLSKEKKPKPFNPHALMKKCTHTQCKYCIKIITFIENKRKEYHNNKELKDHTAK